ncbi:MAG TPA: TIGR04086 family membrane protein [Candidatus Limnocylindria bacterium]|nr:TIGR04086 family membrane protein [Candidatus Limnocylindria bacterium]
MAREVLVRPTATSWGAVIDGWLVTVGVAAILTPIIGVLLTTLYPTRGYASVVPILVGVGLSYLVGGYVAGRMAGYRTSWHGMMVAFFGLFIVLALLVVDIAFAMGTFGPPARLIPVLPLVLGVALYGSAETFAFGGVLGILIAVFAAWLGGLLAPARITTTTAPAVADPVTPSPVVGERTVSSTEVNRPRQRYRLLPNLGRKGGQRMDEVHEAERVDSTDRIEPS